MLIGPSARTVVAVRGGDRRTYLHDVTTQRFDDLEPGDVRSALVLDIHGAPLAEFLVVAGDAEDRLLVADASVGHVIDVLARRTFLADVSFERVDEQVLSLRGDDLDRSLEAAGVAVPGSRAAVASDGVLIARHAFGAELMGDAAAVAGVVARLEATGAATCDEAAMADARVAQGEPVMGREIAPPHLPEELGLLRSHVHLSKGCYPGQEAVARMWMLGRPRRRLARVEWSGPVTPGSEFGEGRAKVSVTATSQHSATGLAFVPATAAVGQRFTEEGAEVAVVEFVGGDDDPPGHVEGMVRRRDRRADRAD